MKDYTICAYMRLSDEDRDIFGRKVESGSITSQRRLIMDFINKQPEFKGCNVIERCDDGISGRYFDNRPQFMDMIEQAKKGKINCIIVKDCSRFGRDYVELGDYLEQLFPFLGVRFIAINDHYDSKTCEGGLDIAFKNLVYDIYSRDLSKKAKESWRQTASRGEYRASQTVYGYRKKKRNKRQLEIDPEAAAVVREIFDLRLAGKGLTDIARTLNDRGVKCPTAYKQGKGESINHKDGFDTMCWTSGGVLAVLNNETYTGTLVMLKRDIDRVTGKQNIKPEEEWTRIEGTHEAIVSKEEFQQVKAMIKPQKTPGEFKTVHYRCAICGKKLNRQNGDTLICARGFFLSDDGGCREVKVKEPLVNETVLHELKAKLHRVMEAEELKLKDSCDSKEIDRLCALEGALESAKKAKLTLMDKLADRSIDRDTFMKKKQRYDEEIAALERKVSDVRMAQRLVTDADDEAKEKIETAKTFLDLKEMNEDAWETFVDEVLVYPDYRMEIHWNFEDQ